MYKLTSIEVDGWRVAMAVREWGYNTLPQERDAFLHMGMLGRTESASRGDAAGAAPCEPFVSLLRPYW